MGVGLAATVLVAALVLWDGLRGGHSPSKFATGAGEQQLVTLKDGSRVLLNTRSSIEVDVTDRERRVSVTEGEVFFDVAHDKRRPFRVVTAFGAVTVLGTRFTVYQHGGSLEVSTESGLVELQTIESAGPKSSVLVPAGRSAVISAAGHDPELRRADLDRIRNWRRKLLEFDAAPLADLLAEFSRYTPEPIRAADADLGELRVSGVFHIGDTAGLSKALESAFGLVVRRLESGQLIVERQPSGIGVGTRTGPLTTHSVDGKR
jgi:transmembrane sensor